MLGRLAFCPRGLHPALRVPEGATLCRLGPHQACLIPLPSVPCGLPGPLLPRRLAPRLSHLPAPPARRCGAFTLRSPVRPCPPWLCPLESPHIGLRNGAAAPLSFGCILPFAFPPALFSSLPPGLLQTPRFGAVSRGPPRSRRGTLRRPPAGFWVRVSATPRGQFCPVHVNFRRVPRGITRQVFQKVDFSERRFPSCLQPG